VDYRHHSWKENTSDYELNHDFATYENTDEQIGYFKEPESVSITKQYGDEAIEIKDPWWKDPATNQRHNPPIYQTLFGSSYNVFLNQNPDDGPHYRLKVPHIGQVTTSNIYVFDHWSGSDVDFGGGATTTTNIETNVVFKTSNASVTANYVSANDIPGYTLTISSNESLSIPAGANIQFADGFKIMVEGTLEINGVVDAPVIFESTVIKVRPKDNASHVRINHCVFRNALVNIVEDEGTVVIEMDNCLITNCGTSIYHHAFYEGIIPTIVMYIDNCTFVEGAGI
jgi:hypothetical protein